MDNTLYLVCVVTRGSSWRSATSMIRGSNPKSEADANKRASEYVRMRALMEAYEDDSDLDEYTDDIDALESLGLIRNARSSEAISDYEEDYEEDSGLGTGLLGLPPGQSTLFLFPEWMTGQAAPNYTEDPMVSNFPSSNDTELLILKPMVVNLGSKSSKCTEIKTPVDPTKLRFIDNKRISIIIGCVAGILVFIFIIISIVMNREEKEEEVVEEDSITGSHKSPGSKTNRSDSLSFPNNRKEAVAAANSRLSRNNSQSSSILNQRPLSLAEAAGPDALPVRHVRNGSSASQPQRDQGASGGSGTLKRGTLSRQQSQSNSASNAPQVWNEVIKK